MIKSLVLGVEIIRKIIALSVVLQYVRPVKSSMNWIVDWGRRSEMKIRVQHENGSIETIELIGPLKVHEGNRLNSIYSNDGLDHYFTQEGYYDGWGTGDPRLLSQENPEKSIEEIGGISVIDPPPKE